MRHVIQIFFEIVECLLFIRAEVGVGARVGARAGEKKPEPVKNGPAQEH